VNPFMRAHGHLPGPTQRPIAAGVLAGTVALVPSLSFARYSGALAAIANETGLHSMAAGTVVATLAVIGGGLYGRLFMRAANDRRGAWLFGIGFGFLLWMLGPGTAVYWLGHRPLATGRAGQALLAAHLLYGLVLGLVFPLVHAVVQRRAPWFSTRKLRLV
jgi:hypothetical protein